MTNVRNRHTAEFKAKVAVEAICQQKTTHELTAAYGIHATPINAWKKLAMAVIPQAFASPKETGPPSQQAEIDEWHRQIGQRVAERDWLKKTWVANSA